MAEKCVQHKGPCEEKRHRKHLCTLTGEFFHAHNAEEYREMVKDNKFKCEFCGRTARDSDNLCYPVDL
jgi:hypothetical protein